MSVAVKKVKGRKPNTRHGKSFERELLLSLQSIPHSYADRQPGRVSYRGRRVIYVQPKIDLMFSSPSCIRSIECKATKRKTFYVSQGFKPGQMDALKKFNGKGKHFRGIYVVHFVKEKKIVVVEDLKLTKITSDMKGYGKVDGLWQIKEYIDECKQIIRKKKQKNTT